MEKVKYRADVQTRDPGPNGIEKTIKKRNTYIALENHKRELNSGELLEYLDKWKFSNYQNFLQCLSVVSAKSLNNKSVVRVMESVDSWEEVLGMRYNDEWEIALKGVAEMYKKDLSKVKGKYPKEMINGIEKWRLFPALMSTYNYMKNTEDVTIASSLKFLEAALLPRYFSLPFDLVLYWINKNLVNKQLGEKMVLPPDLIRVLESDKGLMKKIYN